jgi:HD-GYP domain-containing protein (c-di-GMP phosphodiesterase class II)
MIAVCDAHDGITSDRPYRRALPFEAACERVLAGAGTQFDPLCARLPVQVVRGMEGLPEADGKLLRGSTAPIAGATGASAASA